MQAWNAYLHALEKELGKEVVNKWLRPLKIVQFDACNLYLKPENSFQIDWFEEHIRKRLKLEFLNNNAHPIKVHFVTSEKKAQKKEQKYKPTFDIQPSLIDPSQTFASFLFEEKSAWTVDFLKALKPGALNPIFLQGEKGVGKTHLLMATASLLQKQGLKVFYVHAETFTEHVVSAIRSSEMPLFRSIYRNHDVLIIDDVDILARRAATQEEFFHTFNALHSANKQIVLSSSYLPSSLEDIEPRLISRFEWGIVLSLFPLGKEKLSTVLINKARVHHFPLSNDQIDWLIANFSNTAICIQALDALMVRHKETSPISLAQIEYLLKDLLTTEKRREITPDKILSSVANYFGIKEDDILGPSKAKEYAFPRKIAMYLCREKLQLPYPAIGRFFGRDHTTALSSVRQIVEKQGISDVEISICEIEKTL